MRDLRQAKEPQLPRVACFNYPQVDEKTPFNAIS